jgi:hypothetical protein
MLVPGLQIPPFLEIVVDLNTPFLVFKKKFVLIPTLFIDFKEFPEFFITSTCTVFI